MIRICGAGVVPMVFKTRGNWEDRRGISLSFDSLYLNKVLLCFDLPTHQLWLDKCLQPIDMSDYLDRSPWGWRRRAPKRVRLLVKQCDLVYENGYIKQWFDEER